MKPCHDQPGDLCTEHPNPPDTPQANCTMCQHNRRVLDYFNARNPVGTRVDYRPTADSPPDLQRIEGPAQNCAGRLQVKISGHAEPVRLNHLYSNHLTED